MAQFGTGPQFAAQCPRVDAPDGWRAWLDTDGPVPDALAQRARAMAADASVAMGASENFPLPGVVALLRVEPRVWVRDSSNALVEGCFRVGAVYLPSESPATVQAPAVADVESVWTKAAAILTAVTLGTGIIATLSSWAASSSKKRSSATVAQSLASVWAPSRSPSGRSASGYRRSRSLSRATRRARRRAS